MRSMLFVPGNRPDLVVKALASGVDALIFDLEDSVPEASKGAARDNLAGIEALPVPLFVRVNGADTGHLWEDVTAAGSRGVAGVVLPKAEDPATIQRIDGALTALEIAGGGERGSTAIVPLVESASGVLATYDLCRASLRVRTILFGSGEEGDLVADLGCEWSPEGTGLLTARASVLMAARAAGVEEPMEAVFMDFRNLDGLRTECLLARRLGYVGKVAIHPQQVAVINEVFTPSPEVVAKSRRIVDEFEKAVAQGSASIAVDGRMVDYAVARVSRAILARAHAATASRPATSNESEA